MLPSIFKNGPKRERQQIIKLKQLKKSRSSAKVAAALEKLKRKAARKDNLMPVLIEAVETYATLGEIVNALKEVFGEYREPAHAF